MIKYYFAKHKNGSITYSNSPIKETGAESFEFEVSEDWLPQVQAGEKDFNIANGLISIKDSTRKLEAETAKLLQLEKMEAEKFKKYMIKLDDTPH